MRRVLFAFVAMVVAMVVMPLAAAGQTAPVRVGGDIKPPTRTKYVAPVYPQAARAAGVTGIVIVEASIDPDGRVSDVKVIRSQPQLDQAAVEAVRQWQYTPTMINGTPVSVVMTVTVNFTQTVAFEAALERAKQLYAAGRFDDADRELDQARTLLSQQRGGQTPAATAAPAPSPSAPVGGATFAGGMTCGGAAPCPAAPLDMPVRVGGDVKEPRKIRDVKPAFPPDAMAAGIQGVVILETTIAPDGSVSNAKILRSVPMLDQAALDAVRQWAFTPTLLNGVPVSVIMTVTVNFTLQ